MNEDKSQRYGVVRVGKVLLGIEIEHLVEVFPVFKDTPLPNGSDLLCGGVDLRGRLIPILNLTLLTDVIQPDSANRLGIVVEHNQKTLGFYVQEIIGIASLKADALQMVSENNQAKSSLFGAVFSYKDQFVSVIDIAHLCALPGVHATVRLETNANDTQSQHPPMMTFEAGSALYAVPAVEVYAAVPKQPIEVTAISSGPCLGEITYHNRRVPVVCPVSILGLGTPSTKTVTEVVVLRFPDNQVVGLAVDAIHDIRTYPSGKDAKIPIWQSGENLIDNTFFSANDDQIYSIDVERLRNLPNVVDIARFSEPTEEQTSETSDDNSERSDGNVVAERERYLVVETSNRFAIPLLQVTCIVDPPDSLTPKSNASAGLKGYFHRLGETIALIDLREHLGQGSVSANTAKVLLTGGCNEQMGYLVDRVVSIEVSQWREKEPKHSNRATTVVQLGSGTEQFVLPYFDLLATRAIIGGVCALEPV